jgi:amidohydrolase
MNAQIHSNPELAYEEFQAHDNIVAFLRRLGFKVTPHAFSVTTSFEAEYGSGGRVVTFNAEYDALPEIGHACGHNLIATASIASFLGLAAALRKSSIQGRVRILGTPAEEGGGGKLPLIDAGAFKDVDACLMIHPGPSGLTPPHISGSAYSTSLANSKINIDFTGKPAHAGMAPWQGVNALDAVVLAYNGISMLRQQIQPVERIHGVITNGGARPNVTPARASLNYYIRAQSAKDVRALRARVENCFRGAATATGCEVQITDQNFYYDLRPSKPLCRIYQSAMASLGSNVTCDFDAEPMSGSTDQGNVSYECPSFHGGFAIPAEKGAYNHTPGFTTAAGSEEAFKRCLLTAKGMALAGWKVLSDDHVAEEIRRAFEEDKTIG